MGRPKKSTSFRFCKTLHPDEFIYGAWHIIGASNMVLC